MKNVSCPLPWIHLSINPDGSSTPCCLISSSEVYVEGAETSKESVVNADFETTLKSESRQIIKAKMLNGERPTSCEVCYRQEERGGESRRVRENRYWKDFNFQESPKFLEIRFGNVCNLSCLTCSPAYSSRWERVIGDIKKNCSTQKMADYLHYTSKGVEDKNWYKKESPFFANLLKSLPSVELIQFGGGEPLLNPEHDILLEKIVALGLSKNITLRYNTNLAFQSEKQLRLWEHFKLVEVVVSLDGVGPRNDFIRPPSVFSDIEKNILALDSTSANVYCSILYTVNVLNFYCLEEIVDWKKSLGLKKFHQGEAEADIYIHTLHLPKHLNLQNLPLNFKKEIEAKLQSLLAREDISTYFKSQILDHINYMHLVPVDSDVQWDMFKDYIQACSKHYNKDFFAVLPEFKNYF